MQLFYGYWSDEDTDALPRLHLFYPVTLFIGKDQDAGAKQTLPFGLAENAVEEQHAVLADCTRIDNQGVIGLLAIPVQGPRRVSSDENAVAKLFELVAQCILQTFILFDNEQ